jgi:signal transduction histidine kinase
MTVTDISLAPPEAIREQIASVLEGATPLLLFETVHRRADGSQLPVEVMLQRPFADAGDPRWVVEVVRDISERLRTEEELRGVREELALTEDRERIGRDLHDTVIQQLFALGMSLQAVASRVEPPAAAARVQATVDGLDDTIRNLRTAIFGLQARDEWGRGGLRGSVLRLAVDASRSLGFEPSVRFTGPVESVGDAVAEHLLPVLREALSNVARHAAATRVDVELDVGDEVVLRVTDDGAGASTGTPGGGGGRGLANMRARAEALGGSFRFTPPGDRAGGLAEWRVPA